MFKPLSVGKCRTCYFGSHKVKKFPRVNAPDSWIFWFVACPLLNSRNVTAFGIELRDSSYMWSKSWLHCSCPDNNPMNYCLFDITQSSTWPEMQANMAAKHVWFRFNLGIQYGVLLYDKSGKSLKFPFYITHNWEIMNVHIQDITNFIELLPLKIWGQFELPNYVPEKQYFDHSHRMRKCVILTY